MGSTRAAGWAVEAEAPAVGGLATVYGYDWCPPPPAGRAG